MRAYLAAAIVLAALSFNIGPATAGYHDGPWCAVFNIGNGGIVWDC